MPSIWAFRRIRLIWSQIVLLFQAPNWHIYDQFHASKIEVAQLTMLILFMAIFACLGAGNRALFQLVSLRWPLSTAVASSMIGEIGALGGSILPSAMGLSKQNTGSFAAGFAFFALLAATVSKEPPSSAATSL